jgi:long-subunit fatty acid transport protein
LRLNNADQVSRISQDGNQAVPLQRHSWPKWTLAALVACAGACASSAHASGFYTPDIGAHTTGRGAAWVVGVDDLTAIYLNPAGLACVRGTNFTIENNLDVFHTSYRREPFGPTIHNQNPVDIIQFGALSSDFGLKSLTFSLGFFGPYGVAEKYDLDGPQRYQAVEIKRGQVYYLAGVGWAPAEWARVGFAAGPGEFSEDDTYAFSAFDEGLPATDVVAHVKISQVGAPMYVLGAQFGPFRGFETGFSYQLPTDVKLKGKVRADLPPLFGAFTGGDVYTDNITVYLNFPQIARVGVRQRFTPEFDVEFDLVYTGWSRLEYQTIEFEKEVLMEDQKEATGWRDTLDMRLGGEYEILRRVFVRAGGWHDDSATPPTHLAAGGIEMPRWGASVGFGAAWKGIEFNAAYSHIWMEKEHVTPDEVLEPGLGDPRGVYWGSYDMFLFGVNFNFTDMAAAFKKRGGS